MSDNEIAFLPARSRIGTLRAFGVREAVAYATDIQGYAEQRITEELRERGDNEDDVAEFERLLEELRELRPHLPSSKMKNILHSSHDENFPVIEAQSVDSADAFGGNAAPKWPTPIESLDAITGGCYGMTVFAGEPKVGKSLLAIGSAIEAARAGWRVLYVNAEMSPVEIAQRIAAYVDNVWDDKLVEQMMILNANVGITLDLALRDFIEQIGNEDTRLLIIIDSINRVVDMGMTSSEVDGYWAGMRKWSNFAMQARRHSEGIVSFLFISELNRRQEVKGQSLEYMADLVVRLSNDREQRERAYIDVMLSRSTPTGNVGSFVRDFNRSRFIRDNEEE